MSTGHDVRSQRALIFGVTGPVGCGKTTLIECLAGVLMRRGLTVGAVTNDIYTRVDEELLRQGGIIPPELVLGVETGGCPHTAIRDDVSLNETAVERLQQEHGPIDIVFLESGGDNLTACFSRQLAHSWAFVLDAGGGHKVARKGGPGMITAPLLIINKVDIAVQTHTDMAVMIATAKEQRSEGGPVIGASSTSGDGIADIADFVQLALEQKGVGK